ncbi:MAG: hypothetical protein P4L69_14520, partial [Desulfosporosinus sp.]|nr:hypothetical protein [Desulfosporosinus sp.]
LVRLVDLLLYLRHLDEHAVGVTELVRVSTLFSCTVESFAFPSLENKITSRGEIVSLLLLWWCFYLLLGNRIDRLLDWGTLRHRYGTNYYYEL